MKTISPWAAVKFYAGYLMDGGGDVRIPCIMPGEDFLQSAPSMKPYMGDIAMGEKAALALRITLAIKEASDLHVLTTAEVRAMVYGATLQVRHNRRSERAEAMRKATGEIKKVMATKAFKADTSRAAKLCGRLEPYFREREVI